MAEIGEPLPISVLRAVFSYDPDTGCITRLVRMGYRQPGSVCGWRRKDYYYISYKGKMILAHRAAWALYHGYWPSKPIDHINYDRFDNRIANLRLVTIAENNRNRPKQSNNSSGFKGVTYHRGIGKFHAKITANKRTHSLGYFRTAEEAAVAYGRAARLLHGDHARTTYGG